MGQLGAQGAGLEGCEARVRADAVVAVFLSGAVGAELAQSGGDVVGGREDRAAVTGGAQVLRGVEGEGRGVCDLARALSVALGAVGLGRIL